MIVKLLVTGDCEEAALGLSLRRLFEPLGAQFLQPSKLQGFTSTTLVSPYTPTGMGGVRPLVDKLANALVSEVIGRRRHEPAPDHIILVEDLEPGNVDRAPHVVQFLRDAVDARLDEGGRRDREERAVRERCSFHLLVPMVEAYFFGEDAALTRAGAVRPSLRDPGDVERFMVSSDRTYLDTPEAREAGHWAKAGRAGHPKHYLRYLSDRKYRETKGGAAALATLDWAAVFQAPAAARFARSLFDDIATRIGVASPFPGECAAETVIKDNGVLRNA